MIGQPDPISVEMGGETIPAYYFTQNPTRFPIFDQTPRDYYLKGSDVERVVDSMKQHITGMLEDMHSKSPSTDELLKAISTMEDNLNEMQQAVPTWGRNEVRMARAMNPDMDAEGLLAVIMRVSKGAANPSVISYEIAKLLGEEHEADG